MSKLNKLQKLVDKWNDQYPIGTPVMRYKLINPLQEGNETTTRSQAWVLSNHTAVVLVKGLAGCVILESVVPIKKTI